MFLLISQGTLQQPSHVRKPLRYGNLCPQWGKTETIAVGSAGTEAQINSAGNCSALNLHHDFKFVSALDLETKHFTNYAHGFVGTLDYVLIDGTKLQFEYVLPYPEECDMTSFLPSCWWPSDHIPIVSDISYLHNSHFSH